MELLGIEPKPLQVLYGDGIQLYSPFFWVITRNFPQIIMYLLSTYPQAEYLHN